MMRKFLFAAAVAAAVPLCVPIDASAGCRPFAERRAERKASRVKVAPVRVVMPLVGRAVVAPVAMVLRATRATCNGASCSTK